MKSSTPCLVLLTAILILSNVVYASAACGDQQLVCGEEEQCCEHTVATFTSDGASAPMYTEGRCVPRGQSCGDFWCGNRHCESGLFGFPTVCCVTTSAEAMTAYRCAYSELSCPGNTQQLTIRGSNSSVASGKVQDN